MAEKVKDESAVELGYLEECVSWKLESRFFPSKVGGKPAWLDLFSLPNDILCAKCNKSCIFLCQVYAPIEELESCFHRTLFVFFCKDPDCCTYNDNINFRVFRCQLSRENKFYSFEDPIEDADWLPDVIPERCNLCCVCGNKGTSHCGRCKSAYYCCKEHQIIDWKSFHKERCSAGTVLKNKDTEERPGILLPQFELVTESEDYPSQDKMNDDSKTDEERLEEFEKMVLDGKAGTLQGDTSVDEELQKISSTEDKQFLKFSLRIKKNSGQVLRYERNGEPLWLSSSHIPNKDDIPCCEFCGGPRQFEFQILPQMLNYLGLDSMEKSVDWGTLAVYTCAQSCEGTLAYKPEFLWKQDILSH